MDTISGNVRLAEEALETSFFKWSPDYFAAGMYYETAAKLALDQGGKAGHVFLDAINFNQNGYFKEAGDLYALAADCFQKGAKQDANLISNAARMYEQSSLALLKYLHVAKSGKKEANESHEKIMKKITELISVVDEIYSSEIKYEALLSFYVKVFNDSTGLEYRVIQDFSIRILDLMVKMIKTETTKGLVFHLDILPRIIDSSIISLFAAKERSSEMIFNILDKVQQVYEAMKNKDKSQIIILEKIFVCFLNHDIVRAKTEFQKHGNENELIEEIIKLFEENDFVQLKLILTQETTRMQFGSKLLLDKMIAICDSNYNSLSAPLPVSAIEPLNNEINIAQEPRMPGSQDVDDDFLC